MADPTYSGTRRIIDETEVSAPASDAYLVVDGQASGTNKISYTNAVTNPLTVVNQTISTANNRITTLESEMDTAQTDISSLQSSVSNAQNDITSLKSRTSNAEGAIDTMQTSIAQLESDVDNIESDVDNIENGYNPNLKAGVLMASEPYQTDSFPYLSKQIPVSGREMLELVGGTVAWNQLVDPMSWNNASSTHALSSGTTMYQNHKYLMKFDRSVSDTSIVSNLWFYQRKNGASLTSLPTVNLSLRDTVVFNCPNTATSDGTTSSATNENTWFYLTNNTNITVAEWNIHDLTQMFGSTIADYAYSLEQASAGSGLTWLQKYGFFTEDYYPYNAGELLSVKTSAHEVTGFNQWDEVWERGYLSNSTGENVASNAHLRSKNYIPFMPNKTYYCKAPTSAYMFYYDADKSFVGYTTTNVTNKTFVTPSNAYFARFYCTGTTYNNDICINISSDKNGTYEPYTKTTYPLSNIELRGIPKLVSNELQYDGDVYKADGSVTRRFGIVSFDGTESWSFSVSGGKGRVWRGVTGAKQSSSNIIGTYITADETQAAYPDVWKAWLNSNANPSLLIGVPSTITSASDWQTYLQSHPLVVFYELATPTTETTTPFENPQFTTKNGTEEFIDERTVPIPVGNTSTYYWDMTATDIINYIEELTKPTEDDMIANANIASGKYFMVGNRLFISTAAIAQGATIVPSTNCTEVSLADALNQINA